MFPYIETSADHMKKKNITDLMDVIIILFHSFLNIIFPSTYFVSRHAVFPTDLTVMAIVLPQGIRVIFFFK